jgi:hypothetical protein
MTKPPVGRASEEPFSLPRVLVTDMEQSPGIVGVNITPTCTSKVPVSTTPVLSLQVVGDMGAAIVPPHPNLEDQKDALKAVLDRLTPARVGAHLKV